MRFTLCPFQVAEFARYNLTGLRFLSGLPRLSQETTPFSISMCMKFVVVAPYVFKLRHDNPVRQLNQPQGVDERPFRSTTSVFVLNCALLDGNAVRKL